MSSTGTLADRFIRSMTLLVIGVVLVLVATLVAYLGMMRAGEELTDDQPSRMPRSERVDR